MYQIIVPVIPGAKPPSGPPYKLKVNSDIGDGWAKIIAETDERAIEIAKDLMSSLYDISKASLTNESDEEVWSISNIKYMYQLKEG